MNIGFIKSVKIPSGVIKQIQRNVENRIKLALGKARKRIFNTIHDLVLDQVKKSIVYRGLTGEDKEEGNVRAEFGLTASLAKIAADEIINLVEESLKEPVIVKTNEGSFVIEVPILNDIEEKLRQSDSFVYNNADAGGTVPYDIYWMDWMLDRSVPSKVSQSAIVYTRSKFSRSGQAIMVSGKRLKNNKRLQSLYSRFPYTLPKKLLPTGKSRNFVEQQVGKPEFINKIKKYVVNEIRNSIKDLSR